MMRSTRGTSGRTPQHLRGRGPGAQPARWRHRISSSSTMGPGLAGQGLGPGSAWPGSAGWSVGAA
eukprot:6383459-Pyramimonas_sp.AAC.1